MNVFQYSTIAEANWRENLADMSGFQPQYTFYGDFSIAEFCEIYMRDKNAVKKTYNNVIRSWSGGYKALTEIILVLNHKAWSFEQKVDSNYLHCSEVWRIYYRNLYTELYNKAVEKFFKLYTKDKEAVAYYYEVTD